MRELRQSGSVGNPTWATARAYPITRNNPAPREALIRSGGYDLSVVRGPRVTAGATQTPPTPINELILA